MQKIKEIWGIMKFIVFPVNIFMLFLAIKASKLLGGEDSAAFDPEKKEIAEEIMLDLQCRAKINNSVFAQSDKEKLIQVGMEFFIGSIFLLISAVSISMLFWTFVLGIPPLLSIAIILGFSLGELTRLVIVLLLNLDNLLVDGFFQKKHFRMVISNQELRKKMLLLMLEEKTFFDAKTLYRPALITGSYQVAMNTVVAHTTMSPALPLSDFKDLYTKYFSLDDKLLIIDYLNSKGVYA